MIGISVVICSHNGELRISETLHHLLLQRITANVDWEVILVDNASTDSLVKKAQESWNSAIPFHILSEPRLGVGHARQTGIRAARYSYIVFVDDDNHLFADYLQTAFDLMQSHPKAGAIGGLNEAVFEEPQPVWFNTYQANFAVGPQSPAVGEITQENLVLWTAGMVLRKAAWEQLTLAGFEPMLSSRTGRKLLSGEDSELCYMLRLFGWKLFYFSSLRLEHFMPAQRLRWRYLCRLKRALGTTSIYLTMIRRCYHAALIGEMVEQKNWFNMFTNDLFELIHQPHVLAAAFLGLYEGNYRILQLHTLVGRTAERLRLGRQIECIEKELCQRFFEWKMMIDQN